ncbi:MAG TPA: helix-turn-helix domain-containing protein [Usitatibacter sp.]|nr:helix-turn-helix domain-containing protein [Usitatibacter sp.]
MEPAAARRHSSARHRDGVLDVTVIVQEGGYPSEAIGPIEVFHSAGSLWNQLHGERPLPRFRVRTASHDGRPVTSLCGLTIAPEHSIEEIRRTDIVIVPAAGWEVRPELPASTALVAWLRRMHARGAWIAGICTGVAFLAEAGLVDGRIATTHWAAAEAMRIRYPGVNWQAEQFVTEDGRMLCAGGAYSWMDLSLHLVEKFCGHEVALQCAKALLLSMPRASQSSYSSVALSRPHSDDRIRKSEQYLREHFRSGVSIEALAKRAAMSPRNFIRRFKAATGRLPGEYLQLLRVAAAKELLESDAMPIQTVCAHVGYEDLASFRKVFRRHAGMKPAEYRERFARARFAHGDPSIDSRPQPTG